MAAGEGDADWGFYFHSAIFAQCFIFTTNTFVLHKGGRKTEIKITHTKKRVDENYKIAGAVTERKSE